MPIKNQLRSQFGLLHQQRLKVYFGIGANGSLGLTRWDLLWRKA